MDVTLLLIDVQPMFLDAMHGDPEPAPPEWVSIDGKTLRGSVQQEAYVHLVSIFSTFDHRVLDLGKVEHKSNEIPLVQQLIAASDLKGVIYTLDALHCQKKRQRPSSPPTMTK